MLSNPNGINEYSVRERERRFRGTAPGHVGEALIACR